MPLQSTSRYSAPAIVLHWLIALAIFIGYGLGQWMTGLAMSPQKLSLFAWHKWLGITVLALVVVRLAWRTVRRPPPLPAAVSGWQRGAAHVGHVLLYGLMFAIPLSGWLMSSASGYQTVWFGILPLPDLVEANEARAATLRGAHVLLNYGLLAVLAGHVAAALKHEYVDHDGVLARMAPTAGRGMVAATALCAVAAVAALGVLSLGGGSAEATEPTAAAAAAPTDAASSPGRLQVAFTQMGIEVEADFRRFTVDVALDPAQPERGSVDVRVDVSSFDIGDEMYNDEITGAEWLGAEAHPEAGFTARDIRLRDDGGFAAHGDFTLKGVTRPLVIPFTVEEGAAGVRYRGAFEISRSAYGIGGEDWEDSVEDAVAIRFDVTPQD